MRKLILIVLFSALASSTTQAQVPLPDTAAGKAATEWLAAVNSGDRTQIEALQRKYHRNTPVEGMLQQYRQMGGYNVLAVENSEPGKLVLLIGAKDTDQALCATFTVNAENPTERLDMNGQGIPFPDQFTPKRLSQEEALAALRARADGLYAQDRFSGGILIVQHGKILLRQVWGLADRDTQKAITPDTRFRLGSMSKMFTAVAVLQLVADNKVQLDDPLGKYLSDYPNKQMAVATIRELLDHTAGAGEIFGAEFDSHRATLKTNADYVALYGKRDPSHAPGASDGYDNYGFILLAALIERISGETYYDYVREHVFQPAEMRDSDSLPEDAELTGLAKGYMRTNDQWVSNSNTLPYRGTAAGGGYSTLNDLLKFAKALQSDRLLPATLRQEATKPQNHGRWYGLGFMVYPDDPAPSFGHEGGAPGMNADLRVFPDQDVVIICLSNLDPIVADTLTNFYGLRMPLR